MAAALANLKQEWKKFRSDPPGERFRNHRERAQHRSKRHSMLAVGFGVLLLAGGVVLLFMPGPGLLLIVFGLALVASHSKRLSQLLDRAEPALRRAGRRTKRRWQHMPGHAKFSLVLAMAAVASAFALASWQFVVAPMLT